MGGKSLTGSLKDGNPPNKIKQPLSNYDKYINFITCLARARRRYSATCAGCICGCQTSIAGYARKGAIASAATAIPCVSYISKLGMGTFSRGNGGKQMIGKNICAFKNES